MLANEIAQCFIDNGSCIVKIRNEFDELRYEMRVRSIDPDIRAISVSTKEYFDGDVVSSLPFCQVDFNWFEKTTKEGYLISYKKLPQRKKK